MEKPRLTIFSAATGKALRIEGSDGSLMAFLSTAMPAALRERLTDCLLASFGGRQSLIPTDSAQAGEDYQFQVLYFSWYNRHCTRVSIFSQTRRAD